MDAHTQIWTEITRTVVFWKKLLQRDVERLRLRKHHGAIWQTKLDPYQTKAVTGSKKRIASKETGKDQQ